MDELASQQPVGRRRLLGVLLGAGAVSLLPACARGTGRSLPLPGPDWPTIARESLPKRRFTAARGKLAAPVGVRGRRQWSSETTIASRADRMGRVERITVHHDGMPPVRLTSRAGVRDRIAMIRRSHVGLGWADIGYHFVVDPMGEAWEGRPLVWQGAHVKNRNPRNIGIMVLGNFEVQSPTPEATAALDELLVTLMAAHAVDLRGVKTHREWAPTACPGRNLQRHMEYTRDRGVVSRARSYA
ncbi:MAG: peptidoglycan recognition family protein [Planctomycetota bacterium]